MVALALLTVGIASLLFSFVTQICVRIITTKRKRGGPTPPISVLKPLKGADDDLFENLSSLAAQDYPEFELVLGAEDAMDPALGVARRVARAFPHVRITVVAGGDPIGHNPKVNNLAQLFDAARHDWVLVSDADVRAGSEYLQAMAAETHDPSVGLISSVIVGIGERSFGATLDTLHMNGFIVSSVCAADLLVDHPCVVGKSMLFRRSDLARLGGLDLVKDVLAEDYLLGRAFHRAGLKVALSGYAISAVAGARRFGAFFSRHVRWSQMRRHIARFHYIGEPLLLPTPWLVAALFVSLYAGRASGKLELGIDAAALASLVARCLSESLLAKYLRGRSLDVVDAFLVLVKDLIVTVPWILGWFKTTVEWRGNLFRIGADSLLTPVVDTAESADAIQNQV
jgi:ceramide glucosyltransferase